MMMLRLIVVAFSVSLIVDSALAQTPCISGAQQVFKTGRIPVALVLDSKISENMVEGNSVAPGMCFKTLTVTSFLNKLKDLDNQGVAIATLSISSHGAVGSGANTQEGVLFFEKENPQTIGLNTLASRIRSILPNGLKIPPNRISFRGCRIGGASVASLNSFRNALGASFAEATNCFTSIQGLGPVAIPIGRQGRDVTIKDLKQLKNTQHLNLFKTKLNAEIDRIFPKITNTFGITKHAKSCLVGLEGHFPNAGRPPGIDDKTLLYFLNRGDLAAVWTNRARSTGWAFDSVCFHKLRKVKGGKKIPGGCRLVEVP
jgi:hypothetical protein